MTLRRMAPARLLQLPILQSHPGIRGLRRQRMVYSETQFPVCPLRMHLAALSREGRSDRRQGDHRATGLA